MIRSEFIKVVRTWKDTPFMHQGRQKGLGVDCIGLVICVGWETGLYTGPDYGGYPKAFSKDTITPVLDSYLAKTSKAELDVGDLILFKFLVIPKHVAIYTGSGIIHSFASAGKVVETSFDSYWQKRAVGYYKMLGLENG